MIILTTMSGSRSRDLGGRLGSRKAGDNTYARWEGLVGAAHAHLRLLRTGGVTNKAGRWRSLVRLLRAAFGTREKTTALQRLYQGRM